MPRWLDTIGRVGALKSFGAAVVLSAVNPKNLGLTIAAASSIAAASLSPGGEIAVFAVFLAIACVTVIGPALYYAVARRRASRELDGLKSWLITHNHTVMAILLLLIGAKLLGDGIGILS